MKRRENQYTDIYKKKRNDTTFCSVWSFIYKVFHLELVSIFERNRRKKKRDTILNGIARQKHGPKNTSIEEWLSCMIKTSSNALVIVTIPIANTWTFGLKKEFPLINGSTRCQQIHRRPQLSNEQKITMSVSNDLRPP